MSLSTWIVPTAFVGLRLLESESVLLNKMLALVSFRQNRLCSDWRENDSGGGCSQASESSAVCSGKTTVCPAFCHSLQQDHGWTVHVRILWLSPVVLVGASTKVELDSCALFVPVTPRAPTKQPHWFCPFALQSGTKTRCQVLWIGGLGFYSVCRLLSLLLNPSDGSCSRWYFWL